MAKVASRAPRSRLVISDPDANQKRRVVPYTKIESYTAGQIASHPAVIPYNPRRYQDDNPHGVNRAAKGDRLTSPAPAQSSDLTKRGRSSSPALSKGPASGMSYQGQQGDAATKRGAVTSYQSSPLTREEVKRMNQGSKRDGANRGNGRKEGRN